MAVTDQTRIVDPGLDIREIRSLRFLASLGLSAMEKACDGDPSDGIALPDGRRVNPAESGLMKLEAALIAEGEDV